MPLVIRDLLAEKNKVPTLGYILTKLKSLNVSDVVQHNLFDDQLVTEEQQTIWVWGRTTLYRYMQSIGFIHDRISHYEHAKQRRDIVAMRDDS